MLGRILDREIAFAFDRLLNTLRWLRIRLCSTTLRYCGEVCNSSLEGRPFREAAKAFRPKSGGFLRTCGVGVDLLSDFRVVLVSIAFWFIN
jgi:hypothetical protein